MRWDMGNFVMVLTRVPLTCDLTSPDLYFLLFLHLAWHDLTWQAGRPLILIDGPFGDYETLVKEGHKTVDFYVNGEVG